MKQSIIGFVNSLGPEMRPLMLALAVITGLFILLLGAILPVAIYFTITGFTRNDIVFYDMVDVQPIKSPICPDDGDRLEYPITVTFAKQGFVKYFEQIENLDTGAVVVARQNSRRPFRYVWRPPHVYKDAITWRYIPPGLPDGRYVYVSFTQEQFGEKFYTVEYEQKCDDP